MSQATDHHRGDGVTPILTPAEYHRLLSSRERAAALEVLEERSGPVAVDDLAGEIAEYAETTATKEPLDEEGLAVRLHHVDLPMLDAMGVVDYDAAANSVETIRLPIGVRHT